MYINSQKKDTQGNPPLKKRNESGIAQSEFEKAEEFNSYKPGGHFVGHRQTS